MIPIVRIDFQIVCIDFENLHLPLGVLTGGYLKSLSGRSNSQRLDAMCRLVLDAALGLVLKQTLSHFLSRRLAHTLFLSLALSLSRSISVYISPSCRGAAIVRGRIQRAAFNGVFSVLPEVYPAWLIGTGGGLRHPQSFSEI